MRKEIDGSDTNSRWGRNEDFKSEYGLHLKSAEAGWLSLRICPRQRNIADGRAELLAKLESERCLDDG